MSVSLKQPMKTCKILLTCCIIALISFTVNAQQFDPLIINDTTTVPMVLEETPSFENYNFVYKKRLDSIQGQRYLCLITNMYKNI